MSEPIDVYSEWIDAAEEAQVSITYSFTSSPSLTTRRTRTLKALLPRGDEQLLAMKSSLVRCPSPFDIFLAAVVPLDHPPLALIHFDFAISCTHPSLFDARDPPISATPTLTLAGL